MGIPSKPYQFQNLSASTKRIPRAIDDCINRNERQYARLVEMCLENNDPATPTILAMGRQVVDDLRTELLRADSRNQG